MVLQLLRELLRYQSLEISVILFNEGKLLNEIRHLNIPVLVMLEKNKQFVKLYLELKRVLDRTPPDIIHSHRYKENILTYLVCRKRRGVKTIATQHGMPETSHRKPLSKNHILNELSLWTLSKSFSRVVAVSEDIRTWLLSKTGDLNDKIKMIHNGIVIPKEVQLAGKDEHFVIGSAGRLFPIKDYALMVEIAREVCSLRPDVRFEIAGEGPETSSLKTLVKEYSLENVFLFRGFLEDPFPFYRRLSAYMNTSIHEGIPISVLEAMVHGVPVVAPKVGGLNEVVSDGIDGYLIEDRNVKGFAEKCLRLHDDKQLWLQMSLAARGKVIREFSIDKMAGRYYHLYHDVMKEQ